MTGSFNRKSRIGASALGVGMLLFAAGTWVWHARATAPAIYQTLMSSGEVGSGRIAATVEPLFDTKTVGTTQALVVMRGGKIVAERYGEGIGRDTGLLSRSLGKTITAALVGIMVSDGRLALDSPVPLAAWDQPGDPRGMITLRQLLQMTSGLDHREGGDPLYGSDTVRMLFTDGAADMAAFAEAKPIAHKPGSHFLYSTADTMILCDLMTRMLTDSDRPDARRDAMMEFVRGRFVVPAGLSSLTPEFDARGTMIGGAMLHMTARDYARFGELLRNQGRIDGRPLVPARWVAFMTSPSPRNPAYGGHLWLNRPGDGGELFGGEGSRRLFAAIGHHGQYIIVSPAQGLVVVRMGVTGEKQRAALRDALRRLVDIFPNS